MGRCAEHFQAQLVCAYAIRCVQILALLYAHSVHLRNRQKTAKSHCINEGVIMDPCMGSAHFGIYAFEVLEKIYTEYGYTEREAAASIVQNNLFGLDIDERAAQLANFAIMMKAMQYDKRFLK